MKVLFAYRYGVTGGVCTQLKHRAEALRPLGVEMEVFLRRDMGVVPMLSQSCRVHVGEAVDYRKLLKRREHDLTVIIDTPEFIQVAEQESLPFAIDVHTTYEEGLKYLTKPTRNKHWLVPTPYLQQRLESLGKVANNIHVVPNIVDAQTFEPQAVPRLEHPVISWVGKLDEHKNWDAFLALASVLSRQRPNLNFWMFGGETAPDSVVQVFLQTIDVVGLQSKLRWFPRVAYESMPAVHSTVAASGGLTVVTSRNESFGMSVAEALLCGCPAVVPAVGALVTLVEPREYYRLYPPGDLGGALEAIQTVLNSATARDKLSKERDALGKQWSPATVAGRQKQIFERIASDG